ncbi:hypothetical protein JOB18_010568 [Solea senegalensis]|uniref:Meteorin-like protein n=1 Tax=Solea senegalensis TaxID=28829 RepID=A0AAV6RH99_SOLSE|nr:meteorin-like protein [Solea senegalensis]KAG7504509.1 hypothetical protein JOB18_010568 [Solea senegalensis]
MFSNEMILLHFLALLLRHCAADPCNWTGSGFAAGMDSRIVLQVRLRCTQGWVRWVFPGQAVRLVLEPNLSSNLRTTVCIKPSPSFGGASVFIERAGELELLVTDGERQRQVFCFRADGARTPALYLQPSPLQSDGHWSRRTMSFRYELLRNRRAARNVGHSSGIQTSCRPCNDTELLMAICNSDFASRAEWLDVMVTGSPRTLSMPEVTDTPSALIQARKPTKSMLPSNKVQGGANPAHHS